MQLITCPQCESILIEHYFLQSGKEKCVCRHCGEWETEVIKAGDSVRHEDAAYSEIFTVTKVVEGGHVIQGPEPKYQEPFFTDSKLYVVG